MTGKRSTPKRLKPPPPGLGYPDRDKARVLDLVTSDGVAEAHRVFGIPKATISRWCKAAGVDTAGEARARTEAATEARREVGARAALSTAQLLEDLVDESGAYLLAVVKANRTAAQRMAATDPRLLTLVPTDLGMSVVVEDPDAQDAQKLALALDTLPLQVRDAVGAYTRAIHDLQLLKGEATERGDVVVQFTIPRPNPSTPIVDEANL